MIESTLKPLDFLGSLILRDTHMNTGASWVFQQLSWSPLVGPNKTILDFWSLCFAPSVVGTTRISDKLNSFQL